MKIKHTLQAAAMLSALCLMLYATTAEARFRFQPPKAQPPKPALVQPPAIQESLPMPGITPAAAEAASTPVEVPTAQPTPTPAPEALPAPVPSDQPKCCPQPCIVYRHHGPKLCCGCCDPPIQTLLKVKHPCVCCEADVPLCLPGCCKGEPKVCVSSGFRGRAVVEYQWCCGYRVRVAFRHCGDLLVSTYGR